MIKQMLIMMEDFYSNMFQMEWTILTAPTGKKFISSDNPVYTTNVKPPGFYGSGIGLLAPNCETIAVLTPSTAIFLSQIRNPDAVFSEQASKRFVENINKSTAICSKRFVISKNRKLLSQIVRNVQLEKRKQYGQIKMS